MASDTPPGNMTRFDPAIDRRDLLATLGGAAALGALPAATANRDRDATPAVVRQRGDCRAVVPLTGDRPVEELYDLRIPERFGGDNGASDPGTGPYYGSVGTRDLQRTDTAITFLYDGPQGLSLVAVHGSFTNGGSVSWTISGVPRDATWAVRDDLYLDPDTGEPAGTNYDRWQTSGTTHRIDWTWGTSGTDGGALRGLGDGFALAIHPAFNEAAALYGEYYDGDVTSWQFLSFPDGRDAPERLSLALDAELVVRAGDCDDAGPGNGGGDDSLPSQVSVDVKPGSDGSAPVNPRSRGVVPVSVGGDGFDPAAVDVDAVRFGSPDAVANGGGADPVHGGHVDGDALVLHFRTQSAGFEPGDRTAALVGEYADGGRFEGTADVRTVGQENDREDEEDEDDERTEGRGRDDDAAADRGDEQDDSGADGDEEPDDEDEGDDAGGRDDDEDDETPGNRGRGNGRGSDDERGSSNGRGRRGGNGRGRNDRDRGRNDRGKGQGRGANGGPGRGNGRGGT